MQHPFSFDVVNQTTKYALIFVHPMNSWLEHWCPLRELLPLEKRGRSIGIHERVWPSLVSSLGPPLNLVAGDEDEDEGRLEMRLTHTLPLVTCLRH